MFTTILLATVFIGSTTNRIDYGLPSQSDYVAVREGYVVGFNAKTHQPDWTFYRLTREKLENVKVGRSDDFRHDMQIAESAQVEDYYGSGWSRGHITPAGDMKGSEREMSETFLLSNISPQNGSMNSGAWNRIEQKVRKIAKREQSVYVVTGVFFDDEQEARFIGETKVRVPDFFFKVVLDETPPCKAIGFIAANKDSVKRPWEFAVSVDEVEEATGFNFFKGVENESEIESELNLEDWEDLKPFITGVDMLAKNTDKELREERLKKIRESAKVVNKKTLTDAEIRKLLNQGYKPGKTTNLATSEEQRCLSLIKAAFEAKWDEPQWTYSLKPMVITCQFGPGGRLTGYKLTQSSGDRSADQTVLSAAKRVGSVPGLSAEFIEKYRGGIPIRFTVKPQ